MFESLCELFDLYFIFLIRRAVEAIFVHYIGLIGLNNQKLLQWCKFHDTIYKRIIIHL